MWETLDSCIKVADAESLDALIPALAHLVRSGVGLNTRSVFMTYYANLTNYYQHFSLHCLSAFAVSNNLGIALQSGSYHENCRSFC